MKVMLKEFQQNDYEDLIMWSDNPEFLLQWAGPIFKFPLSYDQLDEYRNGMLQKQSIRKIYSVFDLTNHKHVGHIELNNLDLTNKSATMSRVLLGDKTYRGKGYGKEIVKAVLKKGFDEFKLHRIDLHVFDFNISAKKCYESMGFVHEGISRESRKMGKEYWSLIHMSILEKERVYY